MNCFVIVAIALVATMLILSAILFRESMKEDNEVDRIIKQALGEDYETRNQR